MERDCGEIFFIFLWNPQVLQGRIFSSKDLWKLLLTLVILQLHCRVTELQQTRRCMCGETQLSWAIQGTEKSESTEKVWKE